MQLRRPAQARLGGCGAGRGGATLSDVVPLLPAHPLAPRLAINRSGAARSMRRDSPLPTPALLAAPSSPARPWFDSEDRKWCSELVCATWTTYSGPLAGPPSPADVAPANVNAAGGTIATPSGTAPARNGAPDGPCIAVLLGGPACAREKQRPIQAPARIAPAARGRDREWMDARLLLSLVTKRSANGGGSRDDAESAGHRGPPCDLQGGLGWRLCCARRRLLKGRSKAPEARHQATNMPTTCMVSTKSATEALSRPQLHPHRTAYS